MDVNYTHILWATDLIADNESVGAKAYDLARKYQAKLSLLHVVDSVPLYYGDEYVLPETQEIEKQLADRAKEKLIELGQKHHVEACDCIVDVGATKLCILDFVGAHKIDLVVVGSHSRRGLERLLGSTARAVVNSAPCDVLAVRIVS